MKDRSNLDELTNNEKMILRKCGMFSIPVFVEKTNVSERGIIDKLFLVSSEERFNMIVPSIQGNEILADTIITSDQLNEEFLDELKNAADHEDATTRTKRSLPSTAINMNSNNPFQLPEVVLGKVRRYNIKINHMKDADGFAYKGNLNVFVNTQTGEKTALLDTKGTVIDAVPLYSKTPVKPFVSNGTDNLLWTSQYKINFCIEDGAGTFQDVVPTNNIESESVSNSYNWDINLGLTKDGPSAGVSFGKGYQLSYNQEHYNTILENVDDKDVSWLVNFNKFQDRDRTSGILFRNNDSYLTPEELPKLTGYNFSPQMGAEIFGGVNPKGSTRVKVNLVRNQDYSRRVSAFCIPSTGFGGGRPERDMPIIQNYSSKWASFNVYINWEHTALSQSPNLLENGDAENGLVSWNTSGDVNSVPSRGIDNSSAFVFKEGSQINKVMKLRPHTKYVLSAQMKTENSDGKIAMLVSGVHENLPDQTEGVETSLSYYEEKNIEFITDATGEVVIVLMGSRGTGLVDNITLLEEITYQMPR